MLLALHALRKQVATEHSKAEYSSAEYLGRTLDRTKASGAGFWGSLDTTRTCANSVAPDTTWPRPGCNLAKP